MTQATAGWDRTGSDQQTTCLPVRFQKLAWGVFGLFLVLTSVSAFVDPSVWPVEHIGWGAEYIVWLASIVAIGLLPVYAGRNAQVDLGLPILLASAVLFGPAVAAILAFTAPDPRELRKGVSLVVAVFNHSQKGVAMALAGLAATGVGSIFGGSLRGILLAALAALFVDWAANLGLVATAVRIVEGIPAREYIRETLAGPPGPGALGYLTLGLMSIPLLSMYLLVGPLALVGFVPCLYAARLAFRRGSELSRQGELLESRERTIRLVEEQMVHERAEERLSIAGVIHDEVLQSLHFLTLYAHVIREDLRSGQHRQLDEDVLALVGECDRAAQLTRGMVGELRGSPLGSNGFAPALEDLAVRLRAVFQGSIVFDVDDVAAVSPSVQLLSYQVCREALTNAVKHSGGAVVRLRVDHAPKGIRILVEDDGRGFTPDLVDTTRHFGLELLRDRVELRGGELVIRSALGKGARLQALIPLDGPSPGIPG